MYFDCVAPLRSLAMQWSFSNKSSSHPQLLSFQEEKQSKTGFDSLTSTGLVSLTTTEAFDPDHKSYPASQKNIVPEKQGGVRYTVSNYPTKHLETHAIHRPMNNQTNLAVMPSNSPVVGTTDLRNGSKIQGGPAQLTIFYNGSVCVYDNISPEKAQAIMLLAGNAPSMTPTPTPSAAPVQISIPRSSFLDNIVVSQTYGSTPPRSSPVPKTSIGISQPAGRSSTNNNTTSVKPVVISSSNIAQPLKLANSLGSVSGNFLSSGTVPQFRRKSLARFLEKRKER
ncbi:hypothetical protein BUALT_Bualt07G0009900 [Buddleja alternifolia]|uniref:Protein TIFY n=1 Tax=Buddleja alternifolia TaxID=168488 RepID=A0AAV6X6X3_9LAMI|nr:hypothetical protein BUALT_Bualt07G0009900 [Buddleja alternifolia]